jgi:two-component system phosphate regulon response regulator PhoB
MLKRRDNEADLSGKDKAQGRRISQEFTAFPRDSRLGPQLCVLVVASSSTDAEALQELLQVDQRRIEIATDGAHGLRMADAIRPDMVLCDLQLKGAPSAYGVAQALRSDPAFEHIYLVGLTSLRVAAHEEFALRSGFDRVMPLSGDIDDIELLIHELWFIEDSPPR